MKNYSQAVSAERGNKFSLVTRLLIVLLSQKVSLKHVHIQITLNIISGLYSLIMK